MAISSYLADVWSVTEFRNPELSGYAEAQLLQDTRLGIQTMAGLSLLTQACVALLLLSKGLGSAYFSTNIVLGALSLHVLISAAFVNDIRALHVLGMAFLTIGALAVTFLAHRIGDLNIGMIAAIVMLFVAIPLVPWALREAVVVVGLTYLLLTTSLISVPGRFEAGSLWVLQLLVLGSAVVGVVVTGRNTFIRKQDIRARFELEIAHDEMALLSMKDHLTGAWNRRFLAERFPEIAHGCRENGQTLHVAILDIDDFKGLNDQFGHQVGDEILVAISKILIRQLGENGYLIRLGGDEFQILYFGDYLEGLINRSIVQLQNEPVAANLAGQRMVTLSAGIVSAAPDETAKLEVLYKTADKALYSAKNDRPTAVQAINLGDTLARTGTWRL